MPSNLSDLFYTNSNPNFQIPENPALFLERSGIYYNVLFGQMKYNKKDNNSCFETCTTSDYLKGKYSVFDLIDANDPKKQVTLEKRLQEIFGDVLDIINIFVDGELKIFANGRLMKVSVSETQVKSAAA